MNVCQATLYDTAALWPQFETLANAGVHHHTRGDNLVMDPARISLFYHARLSALFTRFAVSQGVPVTDDVTPDNNPRIFRWALMSAGQVIYPITNVPHEQVWWLGVVFLELLSFILLGTSGVRQCRALKVELLQGFVIRGGPEVPESGTLPNVTRWFERLSRLDPRAAEISTIIQGMFGWMPKRSLIGDVVEALKLVGRSVRKATIHEY